MTYIFNRIFYEVRMWKFICRGIRDTVERNGERAITAAVENCQGNLSVGGNQKQDKENKNNNPGGNQEENKHNGKRCAIKLHTILEAVGLSTVIWFGAFSSHPLCWRKHIHSIACNGNENVTKTRQPCRYKGLVHLIAGTASAQPLNPKNEAPRPFVTVEDIGDTSKEESKHSSPISPEDALEAASRQLQATAGYIDNQLGVMCVEQGHHAQAMDYFKHALLMGDVKACFNLALCYELGLGTTADPTRAVEYYEKAINLGHATAKYNLGVYYAQGRGGLPIDYDKARQLFQDAAGQGVKEAQAALDLEQDMSDCDDNCKDVTEDSNSNSWHLPALFAS